LKARYQQTAEWRKGEEGQWSSFREEWTQERERLAQACDEFEFKLRHVDSGLESIEFYFQITQRRRSSNAIGGEFSTISFELGYVI
jgi:hypothetical protein